MTIRKKKILIIVLALLQIGYIFDIFVNIVTITMNFFGPKQEPILGWPALSILTSIGMFYILYLSQQCIKENINIQQKKFGRDGRI